jgi:hypothetical protein
MGPLAFAIQGFENATTNYVKDLEALTDDQILQSAGGSARPAVDFTYEVAIINARVGARIAGVEPPEFPSAEGWVNAPDEYRTKAAIIEFFQSTNASVLEAAKALTEEDGNRLIPFYTGDRPIYSVLGFVTMHTAYHDAQLNFIQSLAGDLSMHWG